jgi:hypothetical protein
VELQFRRLSWLLTRAGLAVKGIAMPKGGRAPGWRRESTLPAFPTESNVGSAGLSRTAPQPGTARRKRLRAFSIAVQSEPSWSPLHWIGSVAAWVTVALIPVQLVAFAIQPVALGEDAVGWFDFIQDDPWIAFVALDGLLVIDYMLLVAIMAALAAATWRVRPAWALFGLVTFAVAAPAFFASNPAAEMFELQGRYELGNATEQASAVQSAETLLVHSQGTAFHASYILGSFAGVFVSLAMLASPSFSRVGAWSGIVGNLLGFGLYVPKVGLAISALSGLVLVLWFVFVGRDLLRLARARVPIGAQSGA